MFENEADFLYFHGVDNRFVVLLNVARVGVVIVFLVLFEFLFLLLEFPRYLVEEFLLEGEQGGG